ncbi:type I methionyl aminopeptidase [Epilithonimonas sp.]|uniref:type I methionyl aminopeptidase n=1 Tax=Epilithonimonas sp. TaxID=2894511 RepID=UPI002FDE4BB4
MSINNESELRGLQEASKAVAYTLKAIIDFAKPGISTKELDNFGGKILADFGAKSAPYLTYGFPGWTCISVDNEFCHGIPSEKRILKEGDLINIDVSAELNGFWADNGSSLVIGKNFHQHQKLVDASKEILKKAINNIKGGVKISDIGHLMETEAKKRGYKVITNLGGHGIGRSLHDSVVAIETFISTSSSIAHTTNDGWTMIGNKGGFMAQHEHTIVITDGKPIILTEMNEIWN